MSRDLTASTINSISQSVVRPFFAVELLFDGANTIRMWTGQGTLTLEDATEWVGLGTLLSISEISETSNIDVRGASVSLTGVPSEILSLALSEPYQGRVCNIYFGAFSSGGLLQEDGAFILLEDGSRIQLGDTEVGFNQLFSGYMDQMNISESADTSTIELSVENKLVDLERARVARFSSGYQKSIYPDDLGLDFVEDLQDRDIPWGRSSG
jgi:hypothetical protein